VITAEAVPEDVGRERQTGRFRNSFQRAMPHILQEGDYAP
jgi:hypothetical protein